MPPTRFTPSQGKTDELSSDDEHSSRLDVLSSPVLNGSSPPRTPTDPNRSMAASSPSPLLKRPHSPSRSALTPRKVQRTRSTSHDSPVARRISSSVASQRAYEALIDQHVSFSREASGAASPSPLGSPSHSNGLLRARSPIAPSSPAGGEGGMTSNYQTPETGGEPEERMPLTSYDTAPSALDAPSDTPRRGSSSRASSPAGPSRRGADQTSPIRSPGSGMSLNGRSSSIDSLHDGGRPLGNGFGSTRLPRSNSLERLINGDDLDDIGGSIFDKAGHSDDSDDGLGDLNFASSSQRQTRVTKPADAGSAAAARTPKASSSRLPPLEGASTSALLDPPSSGEEAMQPPASASAKRYSLRTAPPKSRRNKAHRISAAAVAGIKPASRFDISSLLKEKANKKRKGIDLEAMAELSERAAQWGDDPSGSSRDFERAMGQLEKSYAARAAEGLSDDEDEEGRGRQVDDDGASDFSDDAFDPAQHWSEAADAASTHTRSREKQAGQVDLAQVTHLLGGEDDEESNVHELSNLLARDQAGGRRKVTDAGTKGASSASRHLDFWDPKHPSEVDKFAESAQVWKSDVFARLALCELGHSQFSSKRFFGRNSSPLSKWTLSLPDILACSGPSLGNLIPSMLAEELEVKAKVSPEPEERTPRPHAQCWILICIMKLSIFHESGEARMSALASLPGAVQEYKRGLSGEEPASEDREALRFFLHHCVDVMRKEGAAADSDQQTPPRPGRRGPGRRKPRPAHLQRRAEHIFAFLRTVTVLLRSFSDCQVNLIDVAAAHDVLRIVLRMACDDRSYAPAKLSDFTEVLELVLRQLPWSDYPSWHQILASAICVPGETVSAQAMLRMLQRFPSESPRARILARNQAYRFLFGYLPEHSEALKQPQGPILPSLRAIADTLASRDPALNPFSTTPSAQHRTNFLELKAKVGLLCIVLSDFALQLCSPPSGPASGSADTSAADKPSSKSTGTLSRTRKAFQFGIEPYTSDASLIAYFYPDCGLASDPAPPGSPALAPSYARLRQLHRIGDALRGISSRISESRGGFAADADADADAQEEMGNNPLDKGRVKDAIQRLTISLHHQTHFYTGCRPGVDGSIDDEEEEEEEEADKGGGLPGGEKPLGPRTDATPARKAETNGASASAPSASATPRPRALPRASKPRASDQSDLSKWFTPPKA